MFAKLFVCALAFIGLASAGVVPAAYVSPYAASYNAHLVNHAYAAPYVAAPAVAYTSPYVAAYSPYSAYPAAYTAPYVALAK